MILCLYIEFSYVLLDVVHFYLLLRGCAELLFKLMVSVDMTPDFYISSFFKFLYIQTLLHFFQVLQLVLLPVLNFINESAL